MRLIDAETAKEMLMRVIFGADRKIDAWVDAMPAVDAIPVEWLEENANKHDGGIFNPYWFVLKKWQNEQEVEDAAD